MSNRRTSRWARSTRELSCALICTCNDKLIQMSLRSQTALISTGEGAERRKQKCESMSAFCSLERKVNNIFKVFCIFQNETMSALQTGRFVILMHSQPVWRHRFYALNATLSENNFDRRISHATHSLSSGIHASRLWHNSDWIVFPGGRWRSTYCKHRNFTYSFSCH